jgi:hypothetical protein
MVAAAAVGTSSEPQIGSSPGASARPREIMTTEFTVSTSR